MTKTIRALACLALFAAGAAQAHDYSQGMITIDHPWARPTPGQSKVGAAYLLLQNSGAETDTLLSAESPVSEKTQIHETLREGDIMKMREVRGGVAVPPGTAVAFKPGGNHIMLLGLKQKLEEGQHIPLTLTFAKAGVVAVEVAVEKAPSEKPEGGMAHGSSMDHMH